MSRKNHPNNAPGIPMVFPVWFENWQTKYMNPAVRKGNVLAIGLAHGKTNWVKNVLAAGEADVHFIRKDVHITNPRVLPAGSDGKGLPFFARRQIGRVAVFVGDIA
jgi:hypothetical protein